MVMDYTTLFFAICSIAIGTVSGKLLAEGSEEEEGWTKIVIGLLILVLFVIMLICYYGVKE